MSTPSAFPFCIQDDSLLNLFPVTHFKLNGGKKKLTLWYSRGEQTASVELPLFLPGRKDDCLHRQRVSTGVTPATIAGDSNSTLILDSLRLSGKVESSGWTSNRELS